MAETLIKSKTNPDGLSDSGAPSSEVSLFHRRIEFHPARKPFTGFSTGGGDFRLETLNPSSEPQRPGSSRGCPPSAQAGKKADGSEFLDNGLDPELSFRITFRRIGAGLENLGNTCFLNSVLQCLTYTEPLAAYLQSGKHQTSCRTAGFCALCAIQKHVIRALQSTGRILAPKDLVSNLRCISRNFRNSRQEDAHEYMVNLLESMHKCCLPSGVPSESPAAYEKSLVHKIFGGRLRSQVKCMQCSFCSNKFDPFLDLSLEIFKSDSLYKALLHFTAKEQLDGGERQYQCQQCKQKVKALKQLTIHKAPNVLTIHLKRFGSHVPGQKIDKKIQFGPSLDLDPFVTGPYDGSLKYTLYGVLVHAGWSTHSGHYYCFVRTSSGMWYSLDDNQVIQVSERKVLEQKAYMLFYFRDTRNFPSKKPGDVIQKENMARAAMGNKTYSISNQEIKGTFQNGSFQNRSNGPNFSTAVAQRDALNAGASKMTLTKEVSLQKTNGLMMADRSVLNRDPPFESSSKVPPMKDSKRGLSVPNPNGEECLRQSASYPKGSDETLKLDNAMRSTTGAKLVSSDVDRSAKHDLGNSIAGPPNYNGLQNSISKKDVSYSFAMPPNCHEDRSTKKDLSDSGGMPPSSNVSHRAPRDVCMTDKMSSEKNEGKASSQDPTENTLQNIDPTRLFNHKSGEHNRIGGSFQESADGDPLSEMAGVHGQTRVQIELAQVSSIPTMTQVSLHRKALNCKLHKKLKKKLLKCQITNVHLGSNILFGKSFRLRKTKHKRRKQQTLRKESRSQEHGDCIAMELGPSTSEKMQTMSSGDSAHSRRKGVKSSSNKSVVEKIVTNSNSDLSMKEFRDGIDQNSAVLATDERPENSCSPASAGNESDAKGFNSSKDSRRDLFQNGLMSMLTRGLEETVVSRWDGTEFLPYQITESSGLESVSIGYVADEWDEEYDRGKRKKVRISKDSFGGPNLFQEIATTKAKLNAKTDQSSSGNRPFRI